MDAFAVLADRPLVVLTGAGLSTDSGIPDYRGPNAPARAPMTYQEFMSGPLPRQRYWARSHLGWGRMRHAEPNAGHRALAALPGVDLLITQNVDGLHEQPGQRDLVALHGRIAEVVCLSCRCTSTRLALQQRLAELNPEYAERHPEVAQRPDGDVALEETSDFVVADCTECGGLLKPDLVFFGENVPAPRVERCYAAVDGLPAREGVLLVVGSSLTVMSGLRFAKRAVRNGTDVVIVNRGATRADDLATCKLERGCSEFLTDLTARRRVGAPA
ncbi:NAD-dependent protein deacetylase 1 [metagenome]|uniref:NAD-dependent protein deacetylase 1 n=1 Tax=metagenome TaxID=256318 RepID=A0A2P2CCE9_9ZZZZ